METFDTIIVGLGAMGSATAYYLSQQQKVLGLEQFTVAHNLGSSHGETRAIREAYFEDPVYVPMVQRAYDNWSHLEKKAQTSLLKQVGGLMIGPRNSLVFRGAEKSAIEHNLSHEILDAQTIKQRFPFFSPRESMYAVWEPRAGVLFVEKCIEAYIKLAQEQGAQLHFSEEVLSWNATEDGVVVTTTKGKYRAKKLVLSAGAWMTNLFSALEKHLNVERLVQLWFNGSKDHHLCPVNIWEYANNCFFYSLPDIGEGIKIALHHSGQITTVQNLNRDICEKTDILPVQKLIKTYMPHVNPEVIKSSVCMYTNTPDGHFIIDNHPQHKNVWVVSPCSGHGFKFASVIGEIITSLITTNTTPFPLECFSIKRFSL
ncbi:N-methyl-L-tryptophan oxidase [Candidatus Uabimicrobium amorphum]|uniref:N-methyltryptophan oxidase n=1 Tax=Uabimicrobium amorphum TaxID=2596890 RepID=A0A5S9F3H0_UABAM|nr:N-methyl-L-tryptophan oxidase [Candidatus Uabimicrobium amorphum]BBM84727.1 N-methyltryptophan oxidase [Candidatus Uabimicrobium amorphum]